MLAGALQPFREALLDAVAASLDGATAFGVETGERIGPALLQVIVAGLRPGPGDAIHAFCAAPGGHGSALRAGWEVRQMHTHVLLSPQRSDAYLAGEAKDAGCTDSPSSLHASLLHQAAMLGFTLFLCGDLPDLDEPLEDSPALTQFRAGVDEASAEYGVTVRYPFLDGGLRHALSEVPMDARENLLRAVARAWLTEDAMRMSPCHEFTWVPR